MSNCLGPALSALPRYTRPGMSGLASVGCAACNGSMSGLGLTLPGGIDLSAISIDALTEAIKKLPDQNILDIVKQLPIDVQKKICQQGVANEIEGYMPWLIGGGLLVAAFLIFK